MVCVHDEDSVVGVGAVVVSWYKADQVPPRVSWAWWNGKWVQI